MAQKPIEDIKLVVRALFDGSYRETGMGPARDRWRRALWFPPAQKGKL